VFVYVCVCVYQRRHETREEDCLEHKIKAFVCVCVFVCVCESLYVFLCTRRACACAYVFVCV